MDDLADVKPGDKLLVHSGVYDRSIATVERLTATQIVCGKVRYRIKDGRRTDESGWGRSWATKATQADVDSIETRDLAAAIERAGRHALELLGLDKLRQIKGWLAAAKSAA